MRLVLIVTVLLGGCSLKSQQNAHIGLHAADVASTYYAKTNGAKELNPIMEQELAIQIAFKTVGMLTTIYATQKLKQMGREKLAKGVLYALNSLLVGIVVNNWRAAQ